MKIALAQLNYRIGDFDKNVAGILEGIARAKAGGADLVVFAELSVCGYPPRDFLEFDDFIEKCYKGILRIAEECTGIAAIVGSPSVNPADKGKPLYNSAYFLADGRIQSLSHKTLLPNYDVFDEYRYFEPNRLPYEIVEYQGSRIAVTICEDLWNITDDPLYVRNPMDELLKLNPDMIINIAASPFHYSQPVDRFNVLKRNAMTYGIPLFYVNQVGGHTELLFDGGSMVINPAGTLVGSLKRFEEDFRVFDSQALQTGYVKSPLSESVISLIHDGLVMGIRDYFHKMGFSKAILGLSGGIDSAVTLVLAAEALGRENIKAVLLPSKFSSEHSISDAEGLAQNLGVERETISIQESFNAIETSLEPQFRDQPFNLTEENIQARVRAVILMALSNKFGYILLNTSNKSEAAVGYGTLYGDMCGGLSVLGDVYKTQVYELAHYINREKEIIPQNSIDKPPSAELRPDQKDSDSLPEYNILDKILLKYIEERKGPRELILAGFDEKIVKRILKLVNTNEYKRYQTPPILRVSPKAFGMGRRMPIVGKYLS
ncbi:MAG: NAD+ synthase [Bacteroidetes bacterium]|nr:NAD+ synthase [Bacteroidota bacterium]